MTREEAIKYVKTYLLDEKYRIEALETLIPELKENEDEKIRREIIAFLRCKNGYMNPDEDFDFHSRWLPWLEKQDQGKKMMVWSEEDEYLLNETTQQLEILIRNDKKKYFGDNVQYYQRDIDWLKSLKDRIQPKQCKIKCEKDDNANEVEPKFKIGDWVVATDEEGKITKLWGNKVELVGTDGVHVTFPQSELSHYHLWTLQDAKDGDILAVENRPFIYNGNFNPLSVGGYCGITTIGFIGISKERYGYGSTGWTMFDGDIYPATKEQCKLLFEKIKDAGYEWDSGKKELIKL